MPKRMNALILFDVHTNRTIKNYQLTLNSIQLQNIFLFQSCFFWLAAFRFSVLLFTPIVHRAGNINDVFVFDFLQRPFVTRHEFDSRWLCVRLLKFAIFFPFPFTSLGSFALTCVFVCVCNSQVFQLNGTYFKASSIDVNELSDFKS